MSTGRGVYVHVPFCVVRCDYCAFATWTDRMHLIDEYVDACVVDIGRRRAAGELDGVTTVYLGGGTPSLLDPRAIARILAAIPRATDAEVTLEANPDSVDRAKLLGYRDAGVTRISLGVQSTQPHVLAALGRTHDRENVARAVAGIVDAGFPSFNLDVIAGVAGESVADFDATLDDVLAFDPPHVSVYGLMVEPGTPLERRIASGELAAPDPDAQADRYLRADARLEGAGLEWYEVSNWARPGHECRHNLGYWTGADCVAIGAAAHGHTGGSRWWNVRRPEAYVERVRAGASPVAGRETPDDETGAFERFGLALRTRLGVPRSPLPGAPAATTGDALAELEVLAAGGFVTLGEGRVRLTPTGRLLASEVTVRAWAALAGSRVGTRYDGVPDDDAPAASIEPLGVPVGETSVR